MDLTIPLVVLAVTGVVTGSWDLLRRGRRDILEVVALLELGLGAGVALNMLLPGAFLLGAVGATALAAHRLDAVGRTRAEETEALLAGVDGTAERLLVVHDHLDRLGLPMARVGTFGALAALGFLGLLSLALMVGGLTYASWPLLLIGSAFLYLPAVSAAQALSDGEERRLLMERLERLGGLPAGTAAESIPGTEAG